MNETREEDVDVMMMEAYASFLMSFLFRVVFRFGFFWPKKR